MANQGSGTGPRKRATNTTASPPHPPPIDTIDPIDRLSGASSFDGGTTGGEGGGPTGRSALAKLAWSEARAKFAWAMAVIMVRVGFGLLLILASYSGDNGDTDTSNSSGAAAPGNSSEGGQGSSSFLLDALDVFPLPRHVVDKALYLLSVVASTIITVVPLQLLISPNRPGIVLGFPPLLQCVRDFRAADRQKLGDGPTPSVPYRIAECAMGRLTHRQLAVVLPVHFVVALVAVALVWFVLPAGMLCGGLDPIPYEEGSMWLSTFLREVIVNAAFVVGLRVLPELMKINHVANPVLWTALIIWPLCCVGVDSSGVGSSFAPDVVYALRCVRLWDGVGEDGTTATSRLGRSAHRLGPVLGGWLGGRFMAQYFPDEPRVV